MTTILALETATHACSAALWLDNKLSDRFSVAPRQHAELILTQVDELLTAAHKTIADCDAIAFGCGPGSFMGVRLATGVAQGLAAAVACPVIAVPTLQTLAQSAYEKTKADRILPGWDARMNAIYWGAYQADEHGMMQAVMADALADPAQITVPDGDWLVAGNAWQVYQDQLKQRFAAVRADLYPDARAVASLAAIKYEQGEIMPAEAAHPIYLRDQVACRP